jgi:exodeoxyribonuclease III
MKIATWNINGVNGRLAVLKSWLAEAAPDVVCLQEIKTPQTTFPVAALEEAGYGAAWIGEKAYNGVAILSRNGTPLEVLRGLPGDTRDAQSRYLEAAVDGVLVACLYLPNGNPQPGPKFDYKLAWFERLHRRAAELVQLPEPVILAGDFNVVPTDEVADIYNPRSWLDDALLQPESRAAWRTLLAQGWTEAIGKLHPGQPMYTFWDYFRQRWPRNAGLRIDFLLLNPAAARRLRAAGVDREMRGVEKASDHAPVWIELG